MSIMKSRRGQSATNTLPPRASPLKFVDFEFQAPVRMAVPAGATSFTR